MTKINFHTHSKGSDGALAPEELVKQAIKAGITHLCFTDHYKRPEETIDEAWKGKDAHFHNKDYLEEVRKMQEKYKEEIKIFYGVELDWLEGYENWIKEVLEENKFDFVLGSIHVLNLNGRWLAFDDKESWDECVREAGSEKELIKKYYQQTRLIARSKLFDCVGHFDYIKKENKNSALFNEKDDWYQKEVLETLDEIQKAEMCIEINARGLLKTVGEQYPSEWILIEARKRAIPITTGSDFHGRSEWSVEDIDTNLEKISELARKAGYSSITIFRDRKKEEVKI
jgi:histidinol-phosphatase (PHP family)